MQTICASGIRVSELSAVTIESLKMRKATINCKGKMRIVILPKELCKMLLEYAKRQKITNGSVFITRTGKPLDRSTIWKMMKDLCEDAGVSKEKVFPHNLRHPNVKGLTKKFISLGSSQFSVKLLDTPYNFNFLIRIYNHLFNKSICKLLC